MTSIRLGVSLESWDSKDEDFRRVEALEEWLKEETGRFIDFYDRFFILYKLSGQLINEEQNEYARFVREFFFAGHWNKMSS
jgi:hypothetical protein